MKGYIPKEQRKKILFISDNILGISGVSHVARSIITGTAHRYNYINVGVSLDENVKGQRFDLSEITNKETGLTDSDVKVVNWTSYDDINFLRQVLIAEKPQAIVFITDPRYYQNLFNIAYEIQQGLINGVQTPMVYIQIWDEFTPPFYNRAAWSSVNMSLCISKQTALMNKLVIGDRADQIKVEYFPHGVDHNVFKPLNADDEKLLQFKKDILKGKDYEFILFFNSRNIQRKNIPTALLAFKAFLRKLSDEEADKCCFILHTQPADHNGTDLPAVIETFFGPRKHQIIFDNVMCPPEELNLRYNLADATVLISEAEGFGLSGLESVMAGTPIIINMTGGMQDYCYVQDENGGWFTPNEKVWSNHNKTYTKHGLWAFPVWPKTLTPVGSIPTPYIFASRCDFKDVANQMKEVYDSDKGALAQWGREGREWLIRDEVGMTSQRMCENFITHMEDMFETWEPLERYSIINVDETSLNNHIEIPDYLFEEND